jgi:2-oxo-3-hexenedioate decarboxylase
VIDGRTMAARLIEAERTRTPIRPFTQAYPFLDADTAYKAQWHVVEHRLVGGEEVAGAKLGLTSRVKQRAMKVDTPLYGWVTSGMLVPQGEPVDLDGLIHPRVEPEIAFLLGRDVPVPATVTGVLAATEAVFAAADVLDSRYRDFRFALPDVVADNASAGRFLLGPRAVPPADLPDLRLLGCVLRVEGEVAATAAGAATLGHPAEAVAWLADRLAERDQVVRAGMLVFSGGLTDAVPLEPGRSVTVELDGLGTIEVYGR